MSTPMVSLNTCSPVRGGDYSMAAGRCSVSSLKSSKGLVMRNTHTAVVVMVCLVLQCVICADGLRAQDPGGVWLPDPNGLMQWFEWIAAEPNEPNWPPLSGEVLTGFKFWLRPKPTQDTVTQFIFRPDDPNHLPYTWESADIIRVNRYSTRLEAGTLWWETVPAEAWWNLKWLAMLNKSGNWSK